MYISLKSFQKKDLENKIIKKSESHEICLQNIKNTQKIYEKLLERIYVKNKN